MTEPSILDLKTPNEKLELLRNRYLDLMQSTLTGSIYRDRPQALFGAEKFDSHMREHGLDWPALAKTMIGSKRIANLRTLVASVIADNVPGDFIETGVWRGGACIFMRAILFAYNITDRCVWAADSFEGLPAADELRYPADVGSDFHTYSQLAVSLEQVQENFDGYGLLGSQTKFLKGWFKDTLPSAPIEQLALIRLDGDMYESTMDSLIHLYPRLSDQGYVIVDDYHAVPACKAATHDYCDTNGIQPEIIEIDGVGVYWRKHDTAGRDNVRMVSSHSGMSDELQISQLSDALIELSDKTITLLNQSLTNQDSEIARLEQSLTNQESEIARLNQSLAEQDIEVARLNHQLGDILSSRSWRMTQPMRSVKHFYKQMTKTSDSPTGHPPRTLVWEDDLHLKINDTYFNLSIDTNELQSGKSTDDTFLLGKPRHMVEKSVAIGQQRRIGKIFEMGILQGGSVVLYDQILQPRKIVAIDFASEPVGALARYIERNGKSETVKPYYGMNQADRPAMEKMLSAEFPRRDIDLIIDDASHLYEETREAFNISFPFLNKGGLYIIEDWAWAHWSGDYWQKDNTYFGHRKALSNLLIELFMLSASRPDFIKEVTVEHSVITVTKGDGVLPTGELDISEHYLLRGKQFDAWL